MELEKLLSLFPSNKLSDRTKNAWLKGFITGLQVHGEIITDYGLGNCGLGIYIYNNDFELLFFIEDKT